MDLHGRMMNLTLIPRHDDMRKAVEGDDVVDSASLMYKCGARDARHAAAELALEAQATIDSLRRALEAYEACCAANPPDPDSDWGKARAQGREALDIAQRRPADSGGLA